MGVGWAQDMAPYVSQLTYDVCGGWAQGMAPYVSLLTYDGCGGWAQDMAPYVSLLMPELQSAVVDPLPEVRSTSARALGSLLRGMGADHFTELVPWLLATLRSEVGDPGSCPSQCKLCIRTPGLSYCL